MAASELNRKSQIEKIEDTVKKLVQQYNKRRGNYSAEINGHRIDLEAEGRRWFTVYADDEKAGDISDEEDVISADPEYMVFVEDLGRIQGSGF